MGVRGEGAVRCAASLLGCTRVRDAVLRRNNCYATTTVSTSIGFQVSPTTGVGGGALQGGVLPSARSRSISGIVSTDTASSECESLQSLAARSIWRLTGEL